jgi:hypothetical protein
MAVTLFYSMYCVPHSGKHTHTHTSEKQTIKDIQANTTMCKERLIGIWTKTKKNIFFFSVFAELQKYLPAFNQDLLIFL